MAENRGMPARGPMRGAGAAMSDSKPKEFKKSIAKLGKYLKAYWIGIIVALVFAVLGTVLSIFAPKILQLIGNEIVEALGANVPIDMARVGAIAVWMIVLYVASALFNFIQSIVMSVISVNISRRMRNDLSDKINRLPLSYFDRQSFGDILSRVTNDVDLIGQTLNQSLSQLVSSFTLIVGIIIMMFTISWQLTLVELVSVPVSFLLVMIIVKISQKHFRRQQNALGDINGIVEEIYSSHNVVKVFNGQEKAEREFEEINKVMASSALKGQFLSGMMMPVMNTVANISYVLVCLVGGMMAIRNNDVLFITSIVAFISYVRSFNQPIEQLATVTNTLQSTAAASERVFDFLEQPEQAPDTGNKSIPDFKGNVEFRHVNFGYTPEKQIIFDFNCKVEAGQKIAIVGPTGAGKTTLVNLLMRFYETDSGEILIDGVSTKDMTREYVRGLFGMVLQDSWLFEGTIRENICYGNEETSEEAMIEACKAANVHHFIMSLPGGYNMVLNEEANISQGQRQLLTIARAMVDNAPMLILDEATSSVDTRTEQNIQEAMDRLMKGRTSFVIAHRLSTIKNADLILVMKNGNIIEQGNHEQLMAQGGFYSELYNSQFSKHGAAEEED
ncbi:MAG: ABC transporter ATP-binding protein [Christensenellales bacterium]|jgi:ABC-type multidrug transport system, ATPase and permease components